MIETTEKLTLDQNPFTAKADATYDAVPILPTYQAQKPDREMQLWLGQVTKDELHRDYRIARDELADAAYMGRWDIVFDILEEGAGRFQEQWVNGARMSRAVAQVAPEVLLTLCRAIESGPTDVFMDAAAPSCLPRCISRCNSADARTWSIP